MWKEADTGYYETQSRHSLEGLLKVQKDWAVNGYHPSGLRIKPTVMPIRSSGARHLAAKFRTGF